MSFLLGTSVAKQDFLEAGDMRQDPCAEFSLPPEGQRQYTVASPSNCQPFAQPFAQPFTMDTPACILGEPWT